MVLISVLCISTATVTHELKKESTLISVNQARLDRLSPRDVTVVIRRANAAERDEITDADQTADAQDDWLLQVGSDARYCDWLIRQLL